MKLIQNTIAAAVLTLATLSGAQAATIFSTADVLTGNLNAANSTKTLDVTHTLTNYVASEWDLTSANLSINLFDNALKGNETWKFTIGYDNGTSHIVLNDNSGQPYKNISNGVNATPFLFNFGPTSSVLSDLQDGVLKFTITALSGDFSFVGSTLTVEANEVVVLPPQDVPEPMSLGLFAIGLLGFGAARRRMK